MISRLFSGFRRKKLRAQSRDSEGNRSEFSVDDALPQTTQSENGQSQPDNATQNGDNNINALQNSIGAGHLPVDNTSVDQNHFVPNFSLHPHEFSKEFRKNQHPHHHGAGYGGEKSKQSPGKLSGDITRLGAAFFTAAIFGLMIIKPNAGPGAIQTIANSNPLAVTSLSEKNCRSGEAIITSDFTDFSNVLSISPLGGVTAPGEILPVPYIRINTRNDGSPFERRATNVNAPATAEIVAIERKIITDADADSQRASWKVHFKPCNSIHIAYDRLDELDPALIERAGGLASFVEIGGPDHIAKQVSLRVASGSYIGSADGFDVALHDIDADNLEMARPERYRHNPYARADALNVSASLLKAITPDYSKARCALDYLRTEDREVWAEKLGDAWGIRRAKGENACRTALIDLKGTAQGAWYTDAAHNGVTTKISAIALAPDSINPDRLIFALHGRLASLTKDMVSIPTLNFAATLLKDDDNGRQPIAANNSADLKQLGVDGFITFEKGSGRINRAFDEIRDGGIYCYQNLRVNFVGPKVNGIFLLQKHESDNRQTESADILKIEARNDFASCADVPEDIKLTDSATGFFR